MRTHFLFLAFIAAVLAGCSHKDEPQPSPGTMPPAAAKQGVTYAADIKPIFDKSCVKCHGAKKQKSGLRLDSVEASVHGSDDGPVFEIGKSEISLLITNVARLGKEDDWMPPIDERKSLTQDEIALVRAWIDQGAK